MKNTHWKISLKIKCFKSESQIYYMFKYEEILFGYVNFVCNYYLCSRIVHVWDSDPNLFYCAEKN